MSMCRLYVVKKARKAPGKCQKCGAEIAIGDGYKWWKGRYTGKRVRCMKPECHPATHERETNWLRAEHIQFEEAVAEAQNADNAADAQGALAEAIGFAEGIRSELENRQSNWEGTGLENSYQYEACGMTKDALDDWISSAESVSDDLGNMEDMPPDPAKASAEEIEEYDADLQAALAAIEDAPELDLGA